MGTAGAMSWLEPEPSDWRLVQIHALTPAESRILELVALGLLSRDIARRLGVTRQAVTWHIGNLFMKLGANNRAGLVARAYATGVILPGCWPPRVGNGFRWLVGLVEGAKD